MALPGAGEPVAGPAPAVCDAAASEDDWAIVRCAPDGEPLTVDTTALPGPVLRVWWFDPHTGTAVDAGSVQRRRSVVLFPPQTGERDAGRDWVLEIDTAA